MMYVNHRPDAPSRGFSLIEVMLAMVLVASAIVTIMALIPVGLKGARNATNSIVMGHILEDAHERLEGKILKDGILGSDPFFYDDEGVYVAPGDSKPVNSGGSSGSKIKIVDPDEKTSGKGGNGGSSRQMRRLYRVDIRLVSPSSEAIKAHAPELKAVILDVTWPVDSLTGDLPDEINRGNRKSITYFVNALTGPGWSKVDPEFEPLVEF